MKRMVFIVAVCLIVSNISMATQCQWGYNAGLLSGYWTSASDYKNSATAPPVAGDEQFIYSGNPATTCTLDATTPLIFNTRIYHSAVLNVTASGSLYSNGVLYIGYDAGTAEVKISGGNYVNSRVYTIGSPCVRIGIGAGSNGILTITGGAFSAAVVQVAYSGNTGKINLFGGELVLTKYINESYSSLGLGANGTIEFKDSGKLILDGDQTSFINGYIDGLGVYLPGYIAKGWMYTNQVGKTFDVSYDGTNTIVTLVPEPATILLLGLSGLQLARRRK